MSHHRDRHRRKRPGRHELSKDESLCDYCTGKCCRYFSLPIDTPKSWNDFDDIRWYLAHGQTLIFVEKGEWFLMVMTRCKYLTPKNQCGIYHDRPRICREYTTDTCEYDEDWTCDLIFETPEQIWEYAEALLPSRRRPLMLGKQERESAAGLTIL